MDHVQADISFTWRHGAFWAKEPVRSSAVMFYILLALLITLIFLPNFRNLIWLTGKNLLLFKI